MGDVQYANLNDFELTDKMKEMSLGYYSAHSSKNCKLNFKEATNVSSQVVAGTVYRFDAKISLKCGDGLEEIVICKNFKFFQPLPFNCNEPDEKCVELDKEKIACNQKFIQNAGNSESEKPNLPPPQGGRFEVIVKIDKFGQNSEDDYDG